MAKKKKHKHGEEEGGEAWLLPYSDLMTLLLAVFIVLFAVSKIDVEKAEKVAEAFRKSMMVGNESVFNGQGSSIIDRNPDGTTSQEDLDATREEIEKFLGEKELGDMEKIQTRLEDIFDKENMPATIKIDTRGLVISLSNAIYFKSGSSEIKVENEEPLLKIAEIIRSLKNYIRIEGHTDNIPISTAEYPSNWELSTARAVSVVRLFVEERQLSPNKIEAVGCGEYKPIADNSTEEGRAKNRRIDIIILSEKYNNLEKQ